MKYLSAFAGLFVSGISAVAGAHVPGSTETSAFEIVNIRSEGNGCTKAEVIALEENEFGEFFIDARFYKDDLGFAAETNGNSTSFQKHCVINYDLALKPGYILERAEFQVDGEYDSSENGTGLVTVRYNVPGSLPQPSIDTYGLPDWSSANPLQGSFSFTGGIEIDDPRLNHCGSTIPLELQVFATARRGRNDARDSFVVINNGATHTNVEDTGSFSRCAVRVRRCS